MKRRILCSIMTALLVFTSVDLTAFATGTVNTDVSEAEVYDAEAFNAESLDSYATNALMSDIQQEIVDKQEEAKAGFQVLEMECGAETETLEDGSQRMQISVKFVALEDCVLLVGLYDEAGEVLLASGKEDADAETGTATVELLADSFPQYFDLKGYLIDKESLAPLSSEFECPFYTQSMQELFAMTTEDFEEDRIVNLDEDITTNFMVMRDDVILISREEIVEDEAEPVGENVVIEEMTVSDNTFIEDETVSENTSSIENSVEGSISGIAQEITSKNVQSTTLTKYRNNLISFDEETNTFVFENADTTLLTVMPGQKFVYNYDENYTLTIKVNGKAINGTRVTLVAEKNADVDEFFSYVKIDENTCDAKLDDSTLSDGLTFLDSRILEDEEGTRVEFEYNFTKSKESALEDYGKEWNEFDKESEYEPGLDVKLKFTIQGGTEYYKTPEKKYFQLDIVTKLEVEGSANLKYEHKLCLGNFEIPIGTIASLEFPLFFEFEAELAGKLTFEMESLYRLRTDEKGLKSEKPTHEMDLDLEVEGRLEAGVSFEPGFEILQGLLCKLALKIGVGVEFTGTLEPNTQDDIRHECVLCIDGEVVGKVKIEAEGSIKLFPKLKVKVPLAEIELGKESWYCDLDPEHIMANEGYLFGVGQCPYLMNPTTIIVVDNSGQKYKNVTLEATTIDERAPHSETFMTDENGIAKGYFRNGSYRIVAKIGKKIVGEKGCKFDKDSKKIYVKIDAGDAFNVSVVALGATSAVLTKSGDLFMWGSNSKGQLGDGTTTDAESPKRVMGDIKSAVMGGSNMAAITNDNVLYMWGANTYGQLGTGDTTSVSTPEKIMEDVKEVQFFSIYNSCDTVAAITTDGTLYMWGSNSKGQLGDGGSTASYEPKKVMSNVKSVTYASRCVYAVTEDNKLYSWGTNYYGMLGIGSGNQSLVSAPTQVMEDVDRVISQGVDKIYPAVAAVKTDGTLYMWGSNMNFLISSAASSTFYNSPIEKLENVTEVSFCPYTYGDVLALTNNGDLYQWGSNSNSATDFKVPTLIANDIIAISHSYYSKTMLNYEGLIQTWSVYEKPSNTCVGAQKFVSFELTRLSTQDPTWVGLDENGDVYTWGNNWNSLLGNGSSTSSQPSPNCIISGKNVVEVGMYTTAAYAITGDGDFYLWGSITGADKKPVLMRVDEDYIVSSVNRASVFGIKNATGTWHLETEDAEVGATIFFDEEGCETTDAGAVSGCSNINSGNTGNSGSVSFADLVPGKNYNYYAVKDAAPEDVLAAENLLALGQVMADETGAITLTLSLRDDFDSWEVFVKEAAPRDFEQTQIVFDDVYESGTKQYIMETVTYRGEELESGVDYVVSGDYAITEAGTYVVTFTGIGIYEGTKTITYRLWHEDATIHTVNFYDKAGELLEAIRLEAGECVTAITPPEYENYNFVGWYVNGSLYDFGTPVTSDLEIYGKWSEYETLPAPVADVASGEVEEGTTVSISCTVEGATIYYTTDMTEPTGESSVYETPFVINEAITIKAFAVKEGYYDSAVAEFAYTIKEVSGGTTEPTDPDTPDDPNQDEAQTPEGLWIEEIEDVTYTGKAIKPEIKVYDGETELTIKKDYNVSYKANTNAGTAMVTISGKGNYSDKLITNFNILKKDLGELEIAGVSAVIDRKGKVKNPKITVKYNGKTLSASKDYTVIWPNVTDASGMATAGVYEVEIIPHKKSINFTGSKKISYEVLANETILLSKAKIKVTPSSISYEDYEEPEVVVTYGSGKNKVTIDPSRYVVEYPEEIVVGKNYITVKAAEESGCFGEKQVAFTVTGRKLSSSTIQVGGIKSSYPYSGGDIEIAGITLSDKKRADEQGALYVLKEDEDYTVTYAKNRNAGTASVSFKGIGAYSGSLKKTFKIDKADIGSYTNLETLFDWTCSDSATYKKTGAIPEFSLSFSDEPMMIKQDFKVSYSNNKKVVKGVESAKITVTGTGNFKGKLVDTFEVVSPEKDAVYAVATDIVVPNKLSKVSTKVKVYEKETGKTLSAGSDYQKTLEYYIVENGVARAITEEDLQADTEITVKITLIKNYAQEMQEESYVETTFRFYRAKASAFRVDKIPDQYYKNGESIEPKLTVYADKKSTVPLVEGEDYTVSYSNNKKKGTAKAIITGCGNGYGGTKTVNFKIKADPIDDIQIIKRIREMIENMFRE